MFCKIVAGEIPAKRVHEDEMMVAFEDIKPEAPVHILIIPRRHIATLNDVTAADEPILGAMMRRAALIAEERGIAGTGYRTVMNANAHAGQSVFHIHLHVLGGRPMSWPPG